MYVFITWLLAGASSFSAASGGAATPPEKALPVFIVEQHTFAPRCWIEGLGYTGQSTADLYEWLKVPRKHALLHIDSHSDLMEMDWDSSFRHVVGDVLAEEEDVGLVGVKLLLDAQIGDFIPSAMLANLIGDVVWMRSDFSIGEYNGPAPGVYEVQLGLGQSSVESYQDDSSDDELFCWKYANKGFQPPRHTYNNQKVERFVSCKGDAPYGRAVAANLTVATLPHLLAQQQRDPKASFPMVPFAQEAWILDIDLDFFSSSDPSVRLFTDNGFNVQWILYHVFQVVNCDDEEDLPHLLKFFHSINRRHYPILAFRRAHRSLAHTSCKILKPKFHRLIQSLSRFSPDQRAAWANSLPSKAVIDEWTGDFVTSMFSIERNLSPHGHSSKLSIETIVMRLEKYLQGFLQQHGEPAVVTLSRSMRFDHYLPEHMLSFVESRVLGMLRRVMASSNTSERQLQIACFFNNSYGHSGGNQTTFNSEGVPVDCNHVDMSLFAHWKAMKTLMKNAQYKYELGEFRRPFRENQQEQDEKEEDEEEGEQEEEDEQGEEEDGEVEDL